MIHAPKPHVNECRVLRHTHTHPCLCLPPPSPLSLQVRKAFKADTAAGKTLVVADYGQLELRILAHMADCK